jgi:hypothetical protein
VNIHASHHQHQEIPMNVRTNVKAGGLRMNRCEVLSTPTRKTR